MANSKLTYLHDYPDYKGKRFDFVCSAKGPSSYDSTNKDIIQLPGFQHYIDWMPGFLVTVSGTYYMQIRPSLAGRRAVWKAVWYTVGGVTEVTNAVDLSGETFLIGGFAGQS